MAKAIRSRARSGMPIVSGVLLDECGRLVAQGAGAKKARSRFGHS